MPANWASSAVAAAPGVKLVEAAQLLGREPLILRAEGRERRLQPLGQAGRAIMVAHAIKFIGHCKMSPS